MTRYRALVVTAHPDDLEFGCGGTIAAWADEGADVTICIVTDGATGTQDRTLMGAPLAKIREQESRRAAKVLGATTVEWLGKPDGYVEYSLDLRRDIARAFRRHRPHRYVVMDPTPTIEDRFVNHPDHRAVALASLDVTLTAGTTPGHFPELLDEGLEPWRGRRSTARAVPATGPRVADVTATIDRKIEALTCHASQVGDDFATIAEWIRTRARDEGARAGFDYGESFHIITQGPGFHGDDELDAVDFAFTPPPVDPRSSPARRPAGGK